MNKFLMLGIQEDYPQFLKDKLRVSNILCLIVFVLALGYSVMIAVRIPELRFVAYFCFIGIPLMVGANYIGLHSIYRALLCILPVTTVYCYHIGVVPQGGTALPSSIAMTLAFSIFPFIVFDIREKLPLALTVLLLYAMLIGFRWTSGWIETSADELAIRTGGMQEISITASFIIVCTSVFFLNRVTFLAELKRKKLMEEVEVQNQELHQKSAELEDQMRKIAQSQVEEQRRSWAAQGYSEFAGIMRKHDDMQKLYDELMAGLVKYIKANQGALYVVEGEKNDLKLCLKACYAYNRKKYQEKIVEIGQGLVGQCYLERDVIYLTEVPQGYTSITSGLGDATPSAILIVPLIANEKVEAVAEFASFQPFEPHVIEFLQKLGEDIAATLSVGRINELTRSLLEKAQQQTEEMRAQEEEMRQNMEELAATQEEMQRKEQEYLRRIEDLEVKLQLNK